MRRRSRRASPARDAAIRRTPACAALRPAHPGARGGPLHAPAKSPRSKTGRWAMPRSTARPRARRGRERRRPRVRPPRMRAPARNPGSLIPGVPASLTSAISAPLCMRNSSSGVRCGSLCSCSDTIGVRMSKCFEQRARVARVLGGNQRTGRETVARPRAQIAEIADRRRNHVEPTRRARVCHYIIPCSQLKERTAVCRVWQRSFGVHGRCSTRCSRRRS